MGPIAIMLLPVVAFPLSEVPEPDASASSVRPAASQPARQPSVDEAWNLISPYFSPPKEYVADVGPHKPLLKFYDGRPVRTASDWAARREEIRKKWHEMMGPWPPLIDKPKIDYVAREKKPGYTQHTINLQVAPGWDPWQSYLLIPDGKGPFPAVLVVYYNPEIAVGIEAPFGGTKTCDYARRLATRGFVALSVGRLYDHAHASQRRPFGPYKPGADCYYPDRDNVPLQPSSFQAYVAANCYNALASLAEVDPKRVGIVGHSYGGKWAMFGACLCDKFACGVWSDGGVTIFNPTSGGANYEARWYLGHTLKGGGPSAYKQIKDGGHDLHELLALMAPRPFLVSGCQRQTDQPVRWQALNQIVAVNALLGFRERVAMSNNRPAHQQTPESLAIVYGFFEHFLGGRGSRP